MGRGAINNQDIKKIIVVKSGKLVSEDKTSEHCDWPTDFNINFDRPMRDGHGKN